jgi:hypothetical protein
MRVVYFGCLKNAYVNGRFAMELGHGMYGVTLMSLHPDQRKDIPWDYYRVDGQLPPSNDRTQGKCVLTYRGGWTAISFWDYTGDSRGGSNSNFLIEGIFTFEDAVAIAREHFAPIFQRFEVAFKLEYVETKGLQQDIWVAQDLLLKQASDATSAAQIFNNAVFLEGGLVGKIVPIKDGENQ